MKLKNNLGLIGMMGSGKSTIGIAIAKAIRFKFIDTDKEIEKEEKKSITKIFEEKGEKYFREIEKKIILELLTKDQNVFAFGGGSFLNKDVRMNIIKRTTSFWLNWKNDTLIDRIAGSRKRPKVQNLTTKELNDMINKRAIIYKEAKYKIECDDLNKNEISKKILSLYIDEKN